MIYKGNAINSSRRFKNVNEVYEHKNKFKKKFLYDRNAKHKPSILLA